MTGEPPTPTQLVMALHGLGLARLDERFRSTFGSKTLTRAMSGLAIKPALAELMAEQLEKRDVDFREDGSVRVPEKQDD